jgi:DNA-binding CsgD family transcriptional regulator
MQAITDVCDALGSSLDLAQAFRDACPALLKAIPADYAAVGVTTTGLPNELDWIAPSMPAAFFESYADLAAHDFVLRAVRGAPNRVLRDSEMLPRGELESNPMYGRARDLGMPIEHVMSTLLHAGEDWSSGISLYRAEHRPFSELDRTVLERLSPMLKNTVHNCRLFRDADVRGKTLEALLSKHGLAAVVFSPSGKEIARSAVVADLVERWFSPTERRSGQLPDELLHRVRSGASTRQGREILRTAATRDLIVRIYTLSQNGRAHRALVLEDVPNAPSAPERWRKILTRCQYQVVDRVVRGWDNRLVADDLGCAEWTVRAHLRDAYPKLGVGTRAQLMNLAMRELLTPTPPDDET